MCGKELTVRAVMITVDAEGEEVLGYLIECRYLLFSHFSLVVCIINS